MCSVSWLIGGSRKGRRLPYCSTRDRSTCPSPQKCKTARSTLPILDPSRFTAAGGVCTPPLVPGARRCATGAFMRCLRIFVVARQALARSSGPVGSSMALLNTECWRPSTTSKLLTFATLLWLDTAYRDWVFRSLFLVSWSFSGLISGDGCNGGPTPALSPSGDRYPHWHFRVSCVWGAGMLRRPVRIRDRANTLSTWTSARGSQLLNPKH